MNGSPNFAQDSEGSTKNNSCFLLVHISNNAYLKAVQKKISWRRKKGNQDHNHFMTILKKRRGYGSSVVEIYHTAMKE